MCPRLLQPRLKVTLRGDIQAFTAEIQTSLQLPLIIKLTGIVIAFAAISSPEICASKNSIAFSAINSLLISTVVKEYTG